MDLGSIKESSTVYNFASTETKKFYDMWEETLRHVTKFCNCRRKIVDSREKAEMNLIWFDKSKASWACMSKHRL